MPKISRALLLYWKHPYGAVQGPMFALRDGLVAAGVSVDLLDLDARGFKLRALRASLKSYDITIGFGPRTLKHMPFGTTWQLLGDHFLLWEVDPFTYGYQRFARMRDFIDQCRSETRLHCLVPDRSYGALMEEVTRPGCVHYFPFGGFGGKAIGVNREHGNRFAVYATLGQELAPVEESLSFVFSKYKLENFSREGIDRLLEKLANPFDGINIAREFIRSFNMKAQDILKPEVAAAISAVDSFEKRRRRYEVSKWLLEAGIELDFFGMGWEIFGGYPNARIRGLSSITLQEALPNYLGLINFDPNWDDGYHDRVYTGLSMGARVIATPNRARSEVIAGVEAMDNQLIDYNVDKEVLRERVGSWQHSSMDPIHVDAFYKRHCWRERAVQFLESLS